MSTTEPGVWFPRVKVGFCTACIVPARGARIDFAVDKKELLTVSIAGGAPFLATYFLYALGCNRGELLSLVYEKERVDTPSDMAEVWDRHSMTDVVDENTGEVLLEESDTLDRQKLERIRAAGIEELCFLRDALNVGPAMLNTVFLKGYVSYDDAVLAVARAVDPTAIPETASTLVDRLFFDPETYDLSEAGRRQINERLYSNELAPDARVLQRSDVLAAVAGFLERRAGHGLVDPP